MVWKCAFLGFVVFATSGCAYLNTTSRSYPDGSSGRLFVWDSEYAAGVGRDNAMCVQGAQTASANSFNAAVELADKLKAGGGLKQSVIVLNPASPQTTYASNAYFAICQLAMNASQPATDTSAAKNLLSGDQIVSMFGVASATAVQISNTATQPQSFASPQLVNFVQSVLRSKDIEMTDEEVADGIENAAQESIGNPKVSEADDDGG
ncbi:MAG: hypothetical protein AAFQ90_09820 [Pseudomonadota bacterium]